MSLSRLTKITGPGVSTDTNWVGNNANFTGVTTTGSSFNVGLTTVHSTLIEAHNIKSTGIITATGGSFSGNVTAVDGTFSGNVSIAGTLTYEDVTNIDSVGIVTALGFKTIGVSTDAGVTNGFTAGRISIYDNNSHNIFRIGTYPSYAPAVFNSSNIVFSTNGFYVRNTAATRNYIGINNSTGILQLGYGAATNHGYKLETSAKGIQVGTGVTIETNGQATFSGIVTATRIITHSIVGISSAIPTHTLEVGGSVKANAQIKGYSGNHVVPSFTFSNAASTGMYLLNSNGTIGFSNAGTHTATLDNNGKLSLLRDLDVDGHTNLDNVSIAGVTTITGTLGSGDITITSNQPKLSLTDSSNDPDWSVKNANGNFAINDETAGATRFSINSSNGVEFHMHAVPVADSTYDLGLTGTRWRNVYADTLYGDGSNLTGISGVTINNNANNRLITGSGTANTLEGESTFTFDGTKVHLNAGSTSHIQIDGTSSYLQVAGIKVWVGAGNRAHNTAVGNGALNAANGGDDCTAVGHNAYANGTSGEDNTVVGSHALDDNVTGHRNCAFGHASLSALTSGYNNSCYGRTSGFYLLNGHNNTFLGYDAGFSDTSGSYNIYAGSGAGMYETTSSDNVAIGYKCFGAEKTGGNSNQFNKNTVVGHQALAQQRITNGDGENVCIGYRAMYNTETAAWRNVVIGFEAGYNNQAAKTTFVGTFAGKGYQSGGNTMCLGYNAGTASSPSGNLTNQQDTVVLGDNNISQFYCSDTSISSSDARDKTDITEWTHGLSFINQLKPVTYRWDKRTWYGTDEEPIGTPDGSKKKARLHLGFLAQDALEVEKSFGYASKKDDMLAVNLNEDESAYGMKYERLVVPLTKAVQELSAEVDKLKAEIAALKSS